MKKDGQTFVQTKFIFYVCPGYSVWLSFMTIVSDTEVVVVPLSGGKKG